MCLFKVLESSVRERADSLIYLQEFECDVITMPYRLRYPRIPTERSQQTESHQLVASTNGRNGNLDWLAVVRCIQNRTTPIGFNPLRLLPRPMKRGVSVSSFTNGP
jgi:hypothetical protein